MTLATRALSAIHATASALGDEPQHHIDDMKAALTTATHRVSSKLMQVWFGEDSSDDMDSLMNLHNELDACLKGYK